MTLLSLPNELLVNIFEYLTYLDLKFRIALTCRRFRSLLNMRSEKAALDGVLFRDGLTGNHHAKTSYLVHPAFRVKRLRFSPMLDKVLRNSLSTGESIARIHFRTWKLDGRLRKDFSIRSSLIAYENALSPPVSKIRVHLPTFLPNKDGFVPRVLVDTGGKYPVTVVDVMKAFMKMYDDLVIATRDASGMLNVKSLILATPIVKVEQGVVNFYMN